MEPAAGIEFTSGLPDAYESVLVPAIFEPYAVELAGRIAAEAPARILEVAAGTGVLTRALAARLPGARITATDLSQPMLDRAARTSVLPSVVWQQADAQELPFPDSSFDLVAGQFGIMFVPDKVKAHREARRVLTQEGRYVLATWGNIAGNEFTATFAEALHECFPANPPSFIERIPHGYHDPATVERHLIEGGFSNVELEVVTAPSSAPSALALATGYLRGTPAGHEIPAGDGRFEEVIAAVADALRTRFGAGAISATMTALIATASA